jgi:large subunit ribosomal protein L9
MEIILMKDVENLGYSNTLVKVKPGYARNFLIPQGFAIVANKVNKEALTVQIKAQEERIRQMMAENAALTEKLEATTIKIATKAGTSGKIFGSVSYVHIANAVREKFGIELDKKKIRMPEEIKMLGKYTCEVILMKEVKPAKVTFEVYNDDTHTASGEEIGA